MPRKPVKPSLLVKAESRHLPPICRLPLTGGRACLDFVNTIDWRLAPDRFRDTLLEYADLLAFALRLMLIDAEEEARLSAEAEADPEGAARALHRARGFRDTCSSLIDTIAGRPGSPPEPTPRSEDLAQFEAARRRASSSERLGWKEGRLVSCPQVELEGLDRPWLCLVRDAEDLLFSALASRIRVCAAEGCGWAYLDTSKNGSRRWCSMRLCGNREKAKRFKTK